MKTYPNCKINLGLRVLCRRPDGYHDLATVFLPVPLCDELEIVPAATNCPWGVDFSQSGILVDCEPSQNICVKAYMLLKKHFPQMPTVRMHLVKNIPFGAGLGGGSADAAFVLKMLNTLFSLGLSVSELKAFAVQLGADCAFFIENMPAYATGIGDALTPLDFNPIEGLRIVMAKPSDAVSTREAYSGIVFDPMASEGSSLMDLLRSPVTEWNNNVVNDFETSIFPLHPSIKAIKDLFYRHGALYSSMSGSGATVFALFPEEKEIPTQLKSELGDMLLFC